MANDCRKKIDIHFGIHVDNYVLETSTTIYSPISILGNQPIKMGWGDGVVTHKITYIL